MRLHRAGDRRGFALLVALAALVIIGGLIVGAFFASTQEYRIGRNTVLQSRAMTAAEYGLNSAIRSDVWNPAWNNNTSAGSILREMDFNAGGGSGGTLQIINLGNENYLVVSEGLSGSVAGAMGRKRLGGFLKLRKPKFKFLGAVTTKGDIKVTGSTEIHGEDAAPTEWLDCPPPDTALPGLAYSPSTPPNIQCSNKGCVTGDPPTVPLSDADNPDTYNVFGDLTYAELAAMADKTIPGGKTFTNLAPTFKTDSLGQKYCARSDTTNWGDPTHAYPSPVCRSYFPIIHVTGNLKLTGGAGQGILLVDGNLSASGGINFYGPVIVKGALTVTGNGSGARFVGGVMAENVYLDDNKVAGNAVVSYSSCAINKALNGSATPMFDAQRGWIEMY
jgi:hypothetical protein